MTWFTAFRGLLTSTRDFIRFKRIVEALPQRHTELRLTDQLEAALAARRDLSADLDTEKETTARLRQEFAGLQDAQRELAALHQEVTTLRAQAAAAARAEEEKSARRSGAAAARTAHDQQVRRVLNDLPDEYLRLLVPVVAAAGRGVPIAGTQESVLLLAQHGLIEQSLKLPHGRHLYRVPDDVLHVLTEALAAWQETRAYTALSNLDENARAFLELFLAPEPQAEPPARRLPHAVYWARHSLAADGIIGGPLEDQTATGHAGHRLSETYVITPHAPRVIVEVLGRPVTRTEVVLDLAHVEGSGASGGGAVQSWPAHRLSF